MHMHEKESYLEIWPHVCLRVYHQQWTALLGITYLVLTGLWATEGCIFAKASQSCPKSFPLWILTPLIIRWHFRRVGNPRQVEIWLHLSTHNIVWLWNVPQNPMCEKLHPVDGSIGNFLFSFAPWKGLSRSLCHGLSPCCTAQQHAQKQETNQSKSETISQNKPLLLTSWLSWAFCHSDGKLTDKLPPTCPSHTSLFSSPPSCQCMFMFRQTPGKVLFCFQKNLKYLRPIPKTIKIMFV
jgi:hypothetical protein